MPVKVANVVTAGEYWQSISQRLAREAGTFAAQPGTHAEVVVQSYYVGHPGGGSSAPVSALSLAALDMRHVDAALRAYDEGCDVVFINANPDYGVPLLRESLPVPVIGAGEATILAARAMGARFSIVTVWPESSALLYERLLAQTGMAQDCVSVRHASTKDDVGAGRPSVYSAMGAGEASIIDRLTAACAKAFDEDGADAVILGCTCMHPVAEELQRRFDRPIIDPVITGFRSAVEAGRLVPEGGRVRSGAAPEHRAAFRAMLDGSVDVESVAECEVCEITMAYTA